jgi:hypothetical protein
MITCKLEGIIRKVNPNALSDKYKPKSESEGIRREDKRGHDTLQSALPQQTQEQRKFIP